MATVLSRVFASVRAAPQRLAARLITTGPTTAAGAIARATPRAPLPPAGARRPLCDAAAALEEQYAKPLQWLHWLYAAGEPGLLESGLPRGTCAQ